MLCSFTVYRYYVLSNLNHDFKSFVNILDGNPEHEKKFCWHFWVHFGIHAQSVSWCVLRRIGVDAKSGNASKSQN